MDVEREIEEIRKRNQRVEVDKAWESSKLRRLFIFIVTYLVAVIWLILILEPNAWLKALVPAGAYWLSTMSLVFIKKIWSQWHDRKH